MWGAAAISWQPTTTGPSHPPLFPRLACSINFGGGGIFGACKNIDIAEINGHVTIRGEAGEVGPDGAVTRPARLLVQFEAAGAHRCAWRRQQQPAVGRHAGRRTHLGSCCGRSPAGWLVGWGAAHTPCNATLCLKAAGSRATVPSRP